MWWRWQKGDEGGGKGGGGAVGGRGDEKKW